LILERTHPTSPGHPALPPPVREPYRVSQSAAARALRLPQLRGPLRRPGAQPGNPFRANTWLDSPGTGAKMSPRQKSPVFGAGRVARGHIAWCAWGASTRLPGPRRSNGS